VLERKAWQRATILIVIALTLGLGKSFSQQPSPSKPQDVEIRFSQIADSTPHWLKYVQVLTWPIVVLLVAVIFRVPMSDAISGLIKGGKVTVAGVSFDFPALASEVKAQSIAITDQQGKIDDQEERIRNLIKYSMSEYIFKMLVGLRNGQRPGGEYVFVNDGSMQKNLRFLIDHGFLQEIFPDPQFGTNIAPLATITPLGHDIMAIRES